MFDREEDIKIRVCTTNFKSLKSLNNFTVLIIEKREVDNIILPVHGFLIFKNL